MLRRRKRLGLMDAESGWLFVMMLRDVMGSGGSGRWWGEFGGLSTRMHRRRLLQITSLQRCIFSVQRDCQAPFLIRPPHQKTQFKKQRFCQSSRLHPPHPHEKHGVTTEILAEKTPCLIRPCKFSTHTISNIVVLTARSNGRRPFFRFTDAILAGPARGLEQWGALTADDWAAAGTMMDENPHWDVQHVIEHFIGPRITPPPVEPAAAVDHPVSTSKRSLELPGPIPKRPCKLERLQAEVQELAAEVRGLAVQAHEQLLALSVPNPELASVPASPVEPETELAVTPEPELAVEPESEPELAVEPEPEPELAAESEPAAEPEPANEQEPAVEAPLVPGPWAGTYVLMPLPLWQARYDLAPDVWPKKVTVLVKAYGPFPERIVIIVAIRYSRGTDMSTEQYDREVARCVEAASTLIRLIRSLPGQADRQFLIYPWIRCNISSTNNWFARRFNLENYPHGIPRTTSLSCRLKELEFVLDNVQPDTKVWWLSIGIDGLTTDIENLRKVQTRWPAPEFTLAVIVHGRFLPDVWQFGAEDICPSRPAAAGIRIRIYSFARLLTGAHPLVDRPARKLLAVLRYINDGKLNGANYDKFLALHRNTMPVSPAGLIERRLLGDRI